MRALSSPVVDAGPLFEAALGEGKNLLLEEDLGAAFFDLRTGLAGELLQKFVNYRLPVAIVVASPGIHGDRFVELFREHRSHPLVRFFSTEADAREWLLAKGAEAA